MRVFVVVLTIFVCFSMPSHSKDIGDLFGNFVGGILNEASRAQQRKQQRRQQIRQLKADINACYQDNDVASCNRALASPVLHPSSRGRIEKARNRALVWQRQHHSGTQTSSGEHTGFRQTGLGTSHRETASYRTRIAQLSRELYAETERGDALQKRLTGLKGDIVHQSNRADSLNLRLNNLTREKSKERRAFLIALGVLSVLTVLLAIKNWQNSRQNALAQFYPEPEDLSPENHQPLGIELLSEHDTTPMPPVIVTGNMANDIRYILNG